MLKKILDFLGMTLMAYLWSFLYCIPFLNVMLLKQQMKNYFELKQVGKGGTKMQLKELNLKLKEYRTLKKDIRVLESNHFGVRKYKFFILVLIILCVITTSLLLYNMTLFKAEEKVIEKHTITEPVVIHDRTNHYEVIIKENITDGLLESAHGIYD